MALFSAGINRRGDHSGCWTLTEGGKIEGGRQCRSKDGDGQGERKVTIR